MVPEARVRGVRASTLKQAYYTRLNLPFSLQVLTTSDSSTLLAQRARALLVHSFLLSSRSITHLQESDIPKGQSQKSDFIPPRIYVSFGSAYVSITNPSRRGCLQTISLKYGTASKLLLARKASRQTQPPNQSTFAS